ncbi:MAG: LssY C-terminal domain-containing protein, partial [Bryobacteraceae bacterium]
MRCVFPYLSVLFCAAQFATAVEISAGTDLQIRLSTPVAASTAKAGQAVQAAVIVPVFVGGQLAIPAGATVDGQVKEIHASTAANDAASLLLNFERLRHSCGKSASLDAKIVAVDNARESVDGSGRINGILASNTGSGQLDTGISKVSDKYPTFAGLLKDVKGAVLKAADPDINYAAGVEMTLQLNKALTWNDTDGKIEVKAIEPQAALAALVNAEPYRTVAQSPPSPSDMTNLMFLGSQEELEGAFRAAGWAPAAALSGQSKLETFRAMAENRGYDEAPVSILLLDRRPPDLVYEKQNNTFSQRHHLRIWRRPETFQGRAVWVCAATHDTGIDFSRESRTFTHKIDPQIDRECSKV